MSSFPCLERTFSGSGQVRFTLGDRLTDRYLEFVAGRCRPNTLRAVAFDLKAFFTVAGKDPADITPADGHIAWWPPAGSAGGYRLPGQGSGFGSGNQIGGWLVRVLTASRAGAGVRSR